MGPGSPAGRRRCLVAPSGGENSACLARESSLSPLASLCSPPARGNRTHGLRLHGTGRRVWQRRRDAEVEFRRAARLQGESASDRIRFLFPSLPLPWRRGLIYPLPTSPSPTCRSQKIGGEAGVGEGGTGVSLRAGIVLLFVTSDGADVWWWRAGMSWPRPRAPP